MGGRVLAEYTKRSKSKKAKDIYREDIYYMTIKYSFITGIVLTLISFCAIWLFEKETSLKEYIFIIWSFFVPIITIQFGFILGKNRCDEENK